MKSRNSELQMVVELLAYYRIGGEQTYSDLYRTSDCFREAIDMAYEGWVSGEVGVSLTLRKYFEVGYMADRAG